ncbi:MAG: HD-GYP domain-containing protein [Gammaproteobacteria bacterium]
MKTIKIQKEDLIIGRPLPWPVYGENQQLLLNKGFILGSEKQKEVLLSKGLYRLPTEHDLSEEAEPTELSNYFSGTPFDTLDAIKKSFIAIIDDIQHGRPNDFNKSLLDLAAVVQKLCRENADAALGALLLDQEALYTHIHPVLCAILTELLTKRRKIPDQDRMSFIAAALTQNIGLWHEQECLSHQTTPLTDKQHKIIFEHPYRSREMMHDAGIDNEDWLNALLLHHERLDGKGYPQGLSGEAIPESVRILSLADSYSAMILPRQYRDGVFVKQALRDIYRQCSSAVDAELAALLIKEVGIYPPGAFVQLANGEIAIVLRRGLKNANAPLVLSIMSPRGAPYGNPQQRDTHQNQLYGIVKVVPHIDNLKLNLSQIWGLTKRERL